MTPTDAASPPGNDKPALRRTLRSQLRQVRPEQRREWSARACAALLAAPEWHQATTVFCFVSLGWEVDTAPILQATLARGGPLAVPRIAAGGQLEARMVTDLGCLQPGPMGILEPTVEAPIAAMPAIDLVVCPGLGFDPSGQRLGQGGGYYDRLLAQVDPARTWVVALALGLQRLARVPAEPHDQPVAALATEAGLERFAPPA